MKDLPEFMFEPIAEESPMDSMKRAVMGYQAGILTLNQSLDIVGMQPATAGESRIEKSSKPTNSQLPGLYQKAKVSRLLKSPLTQTASLFVL